MNRIHIGVAVLVLGAATGCAQNLAESEAGLSYYGDLKSAPAEYHVPMSVETTAWTIRRYLDKYESLHVLAYSHGSSSWFIAWNQKVMQQQCPSRLVQPCPYQKVTQALVTPEDSGSLVMFRVSYYDVASGLNMRNARPYIWNDQPDPREESYGASEQELYKDIFFLF